MAELILGRGRASLWYVGTSIDGIDTSSHVYPLSGVARAYTEDQYLNGTNGNVYTCTKAGTPDTAEWLLTGCIKGAAGELENSLTSTSITKALTARMGKVLNDKINNAGIFPFAVKTSYADKTYTAKVTVENVSTALTFTDVDGKTGRYTYVKAGSDDTAEVVVTIGTSIGMTVGAILDSIESSDAAIKSYVLLDASGNEVENIECNLWQTMNRLVGTITRGNSFNEGTDVYFSGEEHAYINSKFEKVYAQSHIASVYYSIKDDLTLKAYLDSFAMTNEAEIKALTEVTSPLKTIEAYTLKQMINNASGGTVLNVSTDEAAFKNLDVKVELIVSAEGKTEVINTKFVNGEVSVPVKNIGTYRVSVVQDGDTYSADVEVPYFGIYPVALFKDRAWFEVSTPYAELYGKTFKFTSGGKSYPGRIDSNGLATVYVQLKGVYTFAFDDTSLADKVEYTVPTVTDFFVGYPMLVNYNKATITVKTSEDELKGQTVTISDGTHTPITKSFPSGAGEVSISADVNYKGTYTITCESTSGDTAEETVEVLDYNTTNEVELMLWDGVVYSNNTWSDKVTHSQTGTWSTSISVKSTTASSNSMSGSVVTGLLDISKFSILKATMTSSSTASVTARGSGIGYNKGDGQSTIKLELLDENNTVLATGTPTVSSHARIDKTWNGSAETGTDIPSNSNNGTSTIDLSAISVTKCKIRITATGSAWGKGYADNSNWMGSGSTSCSYSNITLVK